jgi:hypothetical protein
MTPSRDPPDFAVEFQVERNTVPSKRVHVCIFLFRNKGSSSEWKNKACFFQKEYRTLECKGRAGRRFCSVGIVGQTRWCEQFDRHCPPPCLHVREANARASRVCAVAYPRASLDATRPHHERWFDGGGSPSRPSGKLVPVRSVASIATCVQPRLLLFAATHRVARSRHEPQVVPHVL